MRLQGKACVITGASRGIGKALALGMAREGANVVVNYVRSREQADDMVKTIRQMGVSAVACQADVARR